MGPPTCNIMKPVKHFLETIQNKKIKKNKKTILLSNGKAPNWYGQHTSRSLMNKRQ